MRSIKTTAAQTLSSAFICLIMLAACSPEEARQPAETPEAAERVPEPTREEAAEIIRSSQEFSQFRFASATFSLPMAEEQMNEQMREYARDLENGGWLRVDSTGTVVLGEKARRDTRWAERYTEGFTDIGPLATKEFVEIRSIERVDAETVRAFFTYRWDPNPIGASIRSGLLHEMMTSPQHATAELRHYHDGWGLYIIRADEGNGQ